MVKLHVAHLIKGRHRMFLLFQPTELVQGESYDLILAFINGDEEFHGGSFRPILRFPNGQGTPLEPVEIPPIEANGSWSYTIEDIVFPVGGLCGIIFHRQKYVDNESNWKEKNFLFDLKDRRISGGMTMSFPVASKEELYQKYSVIVALWASAMSILISAISLVYSIFG